MHRIYFVDLSNPDSPRLASKVALDNVQWAWGLRAQGNNALLLSEYDTVEHDGQLFARYHLRRIDINDLNNPVIGKQISIPGWLTGVNEKAAYIYTIENWWNKSNNTYLTSLHALELTSDTAILQSSLAFENFPSNIEIKNNAAYATIQTSQCPQNTSTGTSTSASSPIAFGNIALISINLSDALNIHESGRTRVPASWAWLRKVEAGRAFIFGSSGIFSYLATCKTPFFRFGRA